MNTLFTIVLIVAAAVICFKWNAIVGLILTVLMLGLVAYNKRPSFYAIKGRTAFANGDFAEAKRWYEKAMNTGKAQVSTRIEYSDALMRIGKFEEAEQVLNNILRYKLKPENEKVAKLRRCMVYYKMDNLKEAYEDAMEIYNDGYKTTYLYGLLGYLKIQMDKNGDDTLAFCQEAYDYNSDDRDITDNLAICYYNKGEYEKAKELSDKILEGNPQFVEAYYHGALIEYALKNYKKVIEYLDKTPDCRWSTMTTVTKEEVEELRSKSQKHLEE